MTTLIRSAEEFGRAVRERRRSLGLTQEDLAARCGVGKRFIVELETGKATIQLGKALTAATEVGLVLADVAGRTPERVGISARVDDGPLADLPRF
jgi:y4mF family transcriptional regulator